MALPKKKRTLAKKTTNSSSAVLIDLDRPDVPAVLDPLDPVGMLPTGSQNQDLQVYVPRRWDYSADTSTRSDTLRLFWGLSARAADEVDQVTLQGPITDSMFPYPLRVPQNRLQVDGRYDIYYTVFGYNGVTVPSFVKVVTLDTQPPSYDKQPEALLFPADLTNNTITEEYLRTHGDKVVLSLPLPLYTGAADGDELILYWSDRDPPVDAPVAIQTIYEADIIAQDIHIDLTGTVIRAANKNGIFHAFYKLRDRAGNETLVFSKPADATVSLIPLPGLLPPPRVPAQESDALVNRADARAQVTVLIEPPLDNVLPTDEILVTWDGTELLPARPAVLPLTVPVPWSVLVAKGLGPLTGIPIEYEVIRPPFPPFPSQPLPINVNFTVAGQDHTGAPALLNPLLALVEIRGRSNRPNELIPGDVGFPVVPSLELYEQPVAGQRLELYWGNWPGPVADYVVQAGDVEGQVVRFSDVPWSVIEAEPNEARLPVYYTTSNGVNEQQSENTFVNVQVSIIDDLPGTEFPDADKQGYIYCANNPWDGIQVKIVFENNRFANGDELLLFWQGYRNFNNTDPIPETYGEFPKTLSVSDIQQGFVIIWIEPYEPYIKPVIKGSWWPYYTLSSQSGQYKGQSKIEGVKLVREAADGTLCEPPADWVFQKHS